MVMETEWERDGSEIITTNISLFVHEASMHAVENLPSFLNAVYNIKLL